MSVGATSARDLRYMSRVRTLTDPAQEHFENTVTKYVENLCELKGDIDSCISNIDKAKHDRLLLESYSRILEAHSSSYEKISGEFIKYLQNMRTSESNTELSAHKVASAVVFDNLKAAKNKLSTYLEEHLENNSACASHLSHATSIHSSQCSRALVRKQAKLEASRAKLRFLKEEAVILQEKAVLEAKLKLKKAECEIEMCEREVSIMKEASSRASVDVGVLAPPQSGYERAEEYVKTIKPMNPIQCEFPVSSTPLNPRAQPFQFTPSAPQPEVAPIGSQAVTDIAKFLVKKDLILSRLTKFDDNPMSYSVWKLSFKGIMTELSTSQNEELDLLIRWLGPESSKQAKTIRACNAGSANAAIGKIWERLDQRFGSPEMVESYLKQRVSSFANISPNDNKRLYDLADLATEIESIKAQPQFRTVFAYYDSSTGVNMLVSKFPWNLQDKWTLEASKYKDRHNVAYPPFSFFVTFIQNQARMKNDPSFQYDRNIKSSTRPAGNRSSGANTGTLITVNKTEATESSETKESVLLCPLHKTKHLLNECTSFRKKSLIDRKKFILSNGICFKCCGPKKHRAKNCTTEVKCSVCKKNSHPTALHVDAENHEGEKSTEVKSTSTLPENVASSCTQICGRLGGTGKSCAKIVPVKVYHENSPNDSHMVYALIDDQSNKSLASSSFFDTFGENGPDLEYTLVSCAGRTTATGRRGDGYVVQSLDNAYTLRLPSLIECNDIPNNRDEIPSSEVALQYPHLRDIASSIPALMDDAAIDLLLGRDITTAHFVHDQRIGGDGLPYAQRLPLGWVIIGQVCLGDIHIPEVNVSKTFVLNNGRPSSFEPCSSEFKVSINSNVFLKSEHDEKIGLSVEDREFLKMMDSDVVKDGDGHWVAPLPFRRNRPVLPNNRPQAVKRARSLDKSLSQNPVKREHVQQFMDKIFERGHAEKAPVLHPSAERWYLPMFGVYHPKKPGSIRVVFDSSTSYEGTSLNNVLMKGPDLSNSLQGILLRFRLERIAVTADVEQMFHNFRVKEEHRDYLRFLWHPDNNLELPLEEFRMTVHVFGNSPSPAVATYGLRRSAEHADTDVQRFVSQNFYVDDGLVSCSSEQKATDLMKRTQQALAEGGRLRLHKIASNSKEVLEQFDKEDLAKDLKNLDIGQDNLLVRRSLGLSWDISSDAFIFCVSPDAKPFTRRGVLSTINSLFDPIGFTAPVTLEGKLLLREIMSTSSTLSWDEPLQEHFRVVWENWVNSLEHLRKLSIPRMYCSLSIENSSRKEVHIFSDASKEAIAAVGFLRVFSPDSSDLGFLLGKAKVAPTHGHTIPRLELCAAVLAIEIAETIKEQLDLSNETFHFYTDSQVVLGYISNDTKRFHVYVANRVSRIRSFCGPEFWSYVPTDENPADLATRKLSVSNLPNSIWIRGPHFLRDGHNLPSQDHDYPLIDPHSDVEVKQELSCIKTCVKPVLLGCKRFSRFSTWASLVRAIMCLKQYVRRRKGSTATEQSLSVKDVERFTIQQVQHKVYSREVNAILKNTSPPKDSTLLPLNPVLDQNDLLCVGGRMKETSKPIIIPKGHHIATLLARHFHSEIHHQGRNLTEAAIRSAGFWIVGGKRLVTSMIRNCVTCKRLRGKCGWTKMADLPPDRLEPNPPFTFVGLDIFGPWPVTVRRTRGGVASSKRWGLLFTCLVSRGVHIELVEELSSSSFINGLRRFLAFRGPVRQFRSDRGTNFVGAVKELNIDSEFIENGPVAKFLSDNAITWIFNPPHASHFGGVWERMIGSCRRILDAMLLNNKSQNITHEVLSTLMAEVCAIVNARPLVPVSGDPESPSVLSPSLLLTQKTSTFTGITEFQDFGTKDAIRSQWKLVQCLANDFWNRWRSEYLHQLQVRKKWASDGETFRKGDIVLLKDRECHRNQWPMGLIEQVYQSDDSKVRKVKVSIVRDDSRTSYVRPISELVRLVELK